MQPSPADPDQTMLAIATALNETAVPLGYSVLRDITPTRTIYIVRQLGGDTAVHASEDPDSIRDYLTQLGGAQCWRLNLDDESIEVTDTRITDRRTGQRLDLSGTIRGHTSIQEYRAATNLNHLSVTGKEPPAVGQWHRWPAPLARD